jgi:hypothetical protein
MQRSPLDKPAQMRLTVCVCLGSEVRSEKLGLQRPARTPLCDWEPRADGWYWYVRNAFVTLDRLAKNVLYCVFVCIVSSIWMPGDVLGGSLLGSHPAAVGAVPRRPGVPCTSPLRYAKGAKFTRRKLTTSIKFRARSQGNDCKGRRAPWAAIAGGFPSRLSR